MWSVFFVFLSYLDRNFVKGEFLSKALDAEKESKELFYMLNNTLCAKSSVVGEYHLHQVTDGAEEVRSVHDSEGRLVDCSVIQNEMQVKSFMHVCRLGLRNQMSSDLKMSLNGVSEAKANCNQLKSKGDRNVITTTKQAKEPNSDAANNKKTRTKRGFTYPGTLWCGAGNIADHYDQLGEFGETDKCCRVHDYCPYVIHAFSSNYGYTNFKWHSLSHCDCDNALKECLRLVNDTSSRVVGQAFFNVIEAPCFEFSFEEQCVERHWYGVCKKYDRVPVAVIKESIPYDFGGIDVIDVLTIAPPKQSDEEKQNTATSESTTQSSFSESKTTAPEEPSLTNVVTAAEDFIKVLATVSTSQSSSADAGKGETQTSEKKRKKNSSKKKKENKKKRGKGKGRKKNKKLDAVLKVDEGTTGAPSTGQTEEVMGKNNFAEESAKMDGFRIKENNFMNSELDSEGNSNKMMRDDPQRTVNGNQDVATITTSIKTDKEPEILQHRPANDTELVSTSPTAHITPAVRDKTRAKLRQRAGKKKQRKNNPSTEAKEEALSTSPSEGVSFVTSTPESPTAAVRNEVTQSTMHTEEKGPVVTTTQKTPIVRTKRPSSRQREGRKRMRKIIASSTEEPPRDISSQDPLLFTGSATVRPTDVLERLGLDQLENPTEGLKDTNGRKNKGRRVIRICYEAVLPDVADTTPLPTLIEKDTEFQLKDPEMNTAPMFPLLQTSTPSSATRRPRNTKTKRSRERGNREKRGKVKRE
ncbi:uncharacterized protein proca1 [Onychostoma macrolepis]|uniref:Phospholipase A2-like central domain-containing protein n=1 Tax=Onychostoma macrolepis TaxID=369639 RepID=A0A7J6C9J9_9TELE|nr:uncharacterized protein proca1 [Onychostoma macrolepis]KAF4103969.1 hypothetical protein G5714_014956 [Onychostoma macrolepis]